MSLVAMPRFWPGQRVRLTAQGRKEFPRTKPLGTVLRIDADDLLVIKRDGVKRPAGWGKSWWQPIPLPELPPDAIAEMLVRAYQAGELTAALALADHLIELHGGTKRGQA